MAYSQEQEFIQLLYEKSHELYREMPWRHDTRGYYVLVSEIMLQQTQVDRVMPKFLQFIAQFPDFQTLAAAPLAEVLVLWSGLGYNRRAKFLHEAARRVMQEYGGELPSAQEQLLTLPGVGKNTTGALMAYVYNQPVLYVETNIRTVYLHHFFADRRDITDVEIMEKLAATLDHEQPRQFYWALMDYGAWLKKNGVRNVAASKHYRKQTPLKGSVREVRGAIIRALTTGDMTHAQLVAQADTRDGRYELAHAQLLAERLIEQDEHIVRLTRG